MLLQISEETYGLLPPELQSEFDQRDAVEVKGKGIMRTYVTRELVPATAAAAALPVPTADAAVPAADGTASRVVPGSSLQ